MRRVAWTLLCLLLAGSAHAEEEGAHEVGVAWFPHVRDALQAAKAAGRPLWVAVHARPAAGVERWPHHIGTWSRMYRDPRVVQASRAYACALLLKWNVPPEQLEASPMHLILNDRGQVLHQVRGWTAETGPESMKALLAFLEEGVKAFGPIAPDAPVLDATRVAAATPADGDERKPIALGSGAPGLSLRLRFELPAPALAKKDEPLVARAQMRWDGHGPFDLELVRFDPGQMVDQVIEVRFGDHPGLADFLTPGDHRLDLELAPVAGRAPFAEGPVRVGYAIVRMGEGGGGGGGNQPPPPEQPPTEQPPPPGQEPPPDQEPPPPAQPPPPAPPENRRIEVVQPLIDSDDLVHKEDAVVAVPDPEGGVKPPKRIPLDQAAPALRRAKDQALRDKNMREADRSFLRRYFEAFEKIAREAGR